MLRITVSGSTSNDGDTYDFICAAEFRVFGTEEPTETPVWEYEAEGKEVSVVTESAEFTVRAAGSLTCFIAVFVSTFCCCQNCLTALIVALCAMVIEVLPLSDFDNLIIPPAIGLIFMKLAA